MTADPRIDRARRALVAAAGPIRGSRVSILAGEDLEPAFLLMQAAASLRATAEILPGVASGEARVQRTRPGDLIVDLQAPASAALEGARRDLHRRLLAARARVLSAPGLGAAHFRAGGPLDFDPGVQRRTVRWMREALERSEWIRITTPSGTDLRIDTRERPFRTDLEIAPGELGNLPAGEVCCAAGEETSAGTLIAEGPFDDLASTGRSPLVLRVRNGRITSVAARDRALAERFADRVATDVDAGRIGELGFGVNSATRAGATALDEKVLGTAHVGFGNNTAMPGGRNRSRAHLDLVLRAPTVDVESIGGSTRRLLLYGAPVEA